MAQRLNMIFFLRRDIERIFDLKRAAEIKQARDQAAAVIGGAILRIAHTRDIRWALPWSTMTPPKRQTIWERMVTTRHYRALHPIHRSFPDGWSPLSAAEMQYAVGYY